MSAHDNLIGRIAQYQDQIVAICGCTSSLEDRRYKVAPLRNAVNPIPQTGPVVPIEDLVFRPSFTFSDKYPQTKLCAPAFVFPGATLDISKTGLSPASLNEHGEWEISTSCRVLGMVKKTNTASGPPSPVTTINYEVQIFLRNDNDIVEFEDIYFSAPDNTAVYITSGKHVVFRRCRFKAKQYGVYFAELSESERSTGVVSATFERCLFTNCSNSGLFVPGHVKAVLLDCTFDCCRSGLTVLGGGHALAQHCYFQRCSCYGAHCTNEDSKLEVVNCTFFNNKTGVCNEFKGNCLLRSCHIGTIQSGECHFGLQINGPQRTVTEIDNCEILGCNVGLTVKFGKVDFVMRNTKVSSAEGCAAVEVRYDTVGNIDFVDCQVSSYDIGSSVRCLVTVDGELIPPKPLHLIKEAAQYNLEEVSVFQLRLRKKARVGDVICWGCRKVEPDGTKFKVCGRCHCVCYCSRKCQVEDWQFHKKDCVDA